MKKEIVINNEILDKIYELPVNDEVKKFLIDSLIWEYDNIDKNKPRSTKKYDSLLDKYVGE